jgi:hypothetical protein
MVYVRYYLDRLFGHRWCVVSCKAHPLGFYFACKWCGKTRNLREFLGVTTNGTRKE